MSAGNNGALNSVPTYREIAVFAGPIVIGLSTAAVVTLVDTWFISRLGTAQLAAVPLAVSLYYVAWLFFVGLVRTVVAFVGRSVGSGKDADAGAVIAQYQWLALLAWPVIMGFVQLWHFVVPLSGISQQVQAFGQTYLMIRSLDAGFSVTFVLYSAVLQASGNSRVPMLGGIIIMLSNIVLDYGLIFGNFGLPRLEVAGSAVATLIAECLGCGFIVFYAHRSQFRQRFRWPLLAWPQRATLRRILAVGVPHGLGDCLEMLNWTVLILIIGRLGDVALAANNIVMQLEHLLFLPGIALGIAASSYLARLVGSGQLEYARRAVLRSTLLACIYMGLLGIPFWFYGAGIARLFSTDATVISQAALIFKVIAIMQIFDASAIVLRAALGGAGDTRVPTLAVVVTAMLVMFPCAYLFSTMVTPGVLGAWLGTLCYVIMLAGLMYWRFSLCKWQSIKLQAVS